MGARATPLQPTHDTVSGEERRVGHVGSGKASSWGLSAQSCANRLCFQPKGGKIDDQIPVIRIQGQYFTMSLRMMKAVWYVVLPSKGCALCRGLTLRCPGEVCVFGKGS